MAKPQKKRWTLEEVHAMIFDVEEDFEEKSDGSSDAGSVDSALEDAFAEGLDIILDVDDPSAPLPHSLTSGEPLEARAPPARPPASPPIASTSGPQRGTRRGKRPAQAPASTPYPPAAKRASEDNGVWHDANWEDMEPPPLVFRPKRTPGPQLDSQVDYHPSDLFQLFFSKEVIRTLCKNTNLYAARKGVEGRKRQWRDVTVEEMLQFISIIIYHGLVRTSAARDLWRKDRLHKFPFPASVMPGYRFEAIMAYLHMSDPAGDAANDQLRGQPHFDGLYRLKGLFYTFPLRVSICGIGEVYSMFWRGNGPPYWFT